MRLLSMRQARPTALVVPTPTVGAALAAFRARYDSSARAGMPAHVTVLYPFAGSAAITEELLSSLEEIAAPVPSFDFVLTDVGCFGDVVYLRPEPADPFIGLTNAVHERWPAYAPYEGRFDSLVPHLTVADDPQASSHLAEIEAVLPLRERASELMLLGHTGRGRWRELRRVPLAA